MKQLLPISLVNFHGKIVQNKVKLSWVTAAEIDNEGFEIMRSANNSNEWEVIGYVEGSGTTTEVINYEFMDENPLIGASYYRLKQIDFDDNYKFSDVVIVDLRRDNVTRLSVFPNPTNDIININLNYPNNLKIDLIFYDVMGKMIWERRGLSNISGVELNMEKEGFVPGIYFLHAVQNNAILESQKIIFE